MTLKDALKNYKPKKTESSGMSLKEALKTFKPYNPDTSKPIKPNTSVPMPVPNPAQTATVKPTIPQYSPRMSQDIVTNTVGNYQPNYKTETVKDTGTKYTLKNNQTPDDIQFNIDFYESKKNDIGKRLSDAIDQSTGQMKIPQVQYDSIVKELTDTNNITAKLKQQKLDTLREINDKNYADYYKRDAEIKSMPDNKKLWDTYNKQQSQQKVDKPYTSDEYLKSDAGKKSIQLNKDYPIRPVTKGEAIIAAIKNGLTGGATEQAEINAQKTYLGNGKWEEPKQYTPTRTDLMKELYPKEYGITQFGTSLAKDIPLYMTGEAIATKLLTKPLSKLASEVTKRLITSSVSGAALDSTQSMARGDTADEVLKNTFQGFAFGIATEFGMEALGKLGKSVYDKIKSGQQVTKTEIAQSMEELKTKFPEIKYNLTKPESKIYTKPKTELPTQPNVIPQAKPEVPQATTIPQQIQDNLGKPKETINDIDNRTFGEASNKNTIPLQMKYPPLQDAIQTRANELIGDVKGTLKGKKTYIEFPDGSYKWGGVKRQTTPSIERILDDINPKPTYKQVEEALKKIVKDNGAENNALSKKIELIIDEDLTNGYKTLDGQKVPAWEDYKLEKSKITGIDYNSKEGNFIEDLPLSEFNHAKNTSTKFEAPQANINPVSNTDKQMIPNAQQTAQNVTQSVTNATSNFTLKNKPIKDYVSEKVSNAQEFITKGDVVKAESEMKSMIEDLAKENKLDKIEEVRKYLPVNLQFFASDEFVKDAISKFKTNTLQKKVVEFQEKDVQDVIDDIDASYEVKTDKGSIEKGLDRLNNDYEGTYNDLIKNGAKSKDDIVVAGILAKDLAKNKEFDKLQKLIKSVRPGLTESGQIIQGVKTWSNTPEGAVMKAQKEVDDIGREIENANPAKKARVDKGTKDVKDAIKKSQDQAHNDAIDEVSKEFSDTTKGLPKKETKGEGLSKKDINGKNTSNKEPIQKKELTPEEMLANKIKTSIKPKDPKEATMIEKMVNELFGVAKESPIDISVNGKKISNISKVSDAIKLRETYVDTWNKAKDIVEEYFKDDETALNILNDYFEKGIKPPYSMATFNKAFNEGLKDTGIDIGKLIKTYYANGAEGKEALINHLIKESGLSGDKANSLANAIDIKFREIKKQKTEQYLKNFFKERPDLNTSFKAKGDIEAMSNTGAFVHDAYKDKVMAKLDTRLKSLIKQSGIDMNELVREGFAKTTFEKQKFVKALSEKLNVNDRDLRTIVDEAEKVFNQMASDKRKSILWNRLKPRTAPTKTTMLEKVMELINIGAYDDEAIKDLIRQKEGIPVLENDDIKNIIDWAEKAKQSEGLMNQYPQGSKEYYKHEYDMRDYRGKIALKIAEKQVATSIEKIIHAPRLAMLSALKTVLTKNFAYNIGNDIYETYIRSIPTSILDMVVYRSVGRTSLMPSLKTVATKVKGNVRGFAEQTKDIIRKTDTSPSLVLGEISQKRIYKNKVGNAIDQTIRNLLHYGDRPTYQGVFDDAIRQQLKIKKTNIVTEDMKTFAHEIAKDRVLQNESYTVKGLQKIRRGMNETGKGLVGIGTSEGGVGNITSPFINTAANLAEKTVENTPVGALKIYSLVQDVKKAVPGSVEQQLAKRKLVDALGRIFTGTALMGGTIGLVSKGIATGGASKDKDKASWDLEHGTQPYSFNLGGMNIPYKDFAPIGTIMSIGADIAKNKKEGSSMVQAIAESSKTGINTFMQQSFLKGFNNLFSSGNLGTGIGNTVSSVPSQLIPQTVRTLANYTDTYQRETYDPNPFINKLNTLKASIPFLRQSLPIKVGTEGQNLKTFDNKSGIARFFDAFLVPNPSTTIKTSPITNEIDKIYTNTKDNNIIPKLAPKDFTNDGTKIILSTKERTQWQKTMGTITMGKLNNLFNSEEYKNAYTARLSNDIRLKYAQGKLTKQQIQAKLIAKEIENSYEEAKDELLTSRGIR